MPSAAALATVLLLCSLEARASAQTGPAAEGGIGRVPDTFSYAEPAAENRVRALLEIAGVLTVGFLFYVSTNDFLAADFDTGYRWPVFRSKLLGQAFHLDINGLNTNFVGHPIGGSSYYTMARSNRLNVAESLAFAIGGSLLWEVFGEVSEIVSTNDMIVTPLAGVSIAEPLLQLGAFFDRSRPSLLNRILGAVFAPFKTLNDAFDGAKLARTAQVDEHGFPLNEWHQFDLGLGLATTLQAPSPVSTANNRSQELRAKLVSQLARLPGYDAAADGSLLFADANMSSLHATASVTHHGLVDLDLNTRFAFMGYFYRSASRDPAGELKGHGAIVALTMGFQYLLHDYDRDRARPKDVISSVQPLGALLQYRARSGRAHASLQLLGGADFGAARPYARGAYQLLQASQNTDLPLVIVKNGYYFMTGGHVSTSVAVGYGWFEVSGGLRYERYAEIGIAIPTSERFMILEARAELLWGSSPGRVCLLAQRRSRSGRMGDALAERSESSLGLELGVRY